MAVQVHNLMPTSLRVEGVKVVLHIREQAVLGLWMAESAGQRRQDHNTRLCRSPLNMACDSHKGHRTLRLPLALYTRNEVKVALVWNEKGA
jgi:hypothetical protein